MADLTEIFVELLEEGVEVYRPVEAMSLGGDLYRIESLQSDPSEVWRFATGSVVRCRPTRFDGGYLGLLAIENAGIKT
jgi:hypothetical protein